MVGRTELDIETNPPPDRSIEFDITPTVLNRLGIDVALGVPEIWRYHEGQPEVFVLEVEAYVSRKESRAFPFLPLEELSIFPDIGQSLTDTERCSSSAAGCGSGSNQRPSG